MSGETATTEQVPIGEGIFVVPQSPEKPYLLGSKCRNCGEVLFPPRRGCRRCSGTTVDIVPLSRKARLYSFTTVLVKLPMTKVDPPYFVGVVELLEGERIRTLLSAQNPSSLQIGDEMEVSIEPVYKDEQGREVLGWKFKPVKEG